MRKSERLKKNIRSYFFDHYIQKEILSYSWIVLLSFISGAIFAFGFSTFITSYTDESLRLATGGFSGFTQSVVLLITMNTSISPSILQSILYFAVNIPAIIFAFFKIGKKFAITTTINVAIGSLFISIFSNWSFVQDIANNQFIINSPLCRVLFAGVCTGISSGIAFKGGTSCGGMDIVTCYLSLKKSTGVGKYNVYANSIVIAFYVICNLIATPNRVVESVLIIPFALIYFLVSSAIIDVIHVKNKKISVEIITNVDYMEDILVSVLTHSCTVVKGHGAYAKTERLIIKMVISSFETRKVVSIIKRVDPSAFITLVPLNQVYGNFFINSFE